MSGDDRTRTGDLSPDKRVLSPLSYVPEWRGWDSNPRSRAHEAREDSRSSTALRTADGGGSKVRRRLRSGRQESNLRSPVPKTGGVAKLPHDQMNVCLPAVTIGACDSSSPRPRWCSPPAAAGHNDT